MRIEVISQKQPMTTEHELHQLGHGIILRQVTETAKFPDGREYSVRFNEYLLPANTPTGRPQWQTGYARQATDQLPNPTIFSQQEH